MTFSRKLSSIAAVLLVAGLTLSACGDKDDSGKDDTSGSSSGGAAKTATLTKANFAEVIGASQAKAKTAHVDMSIGVSGQSVTAQGDVKVGSSIRDTAMTMTMDMGSTMKLEMRLVNQALYMDMGQMTGDKFVKIDLTDKNDPFVKQFGQIADQMDPAKQLDQFKDALTSFEKKGAPKTIDGVKAQPYVVTVDTTKIKAFKDLPAASTSQLPDTIVYTMYVGSDDLPRRMEFELAGTTSRVDYSKWGEPVDIKAPAAGDISDKKIGDLTGGAALG